MADKTSFEPGANADSGGVPTSRTITTGTGLTGGGDLSSNRTLALATTGVAAGSYTNASVTFNAYGQATAASSGAASKTLWWSPALAAQALTPTAFGNTDITFGQSIIPTLPIVATGARMYWTASTGTIKFTLWNPSGTAVATGTVVVASIPQMVTVTFGTPYSVPESLLYQEFIISAFQTTGSHDCDGFVVTDLNPPTAPCLVGAGMMINRVSGVYSTASSETFPVLVASAAVAIDLIWTLA